MGAFIYFHDVCQTEVPKDVLYLHFIIFLNTNAQCKNCSASYPVRHEVQPDRKNSKFYSYWHVVLTQYLITNYPLFHSCELLCWESCSNRHEWRQTETLIETLGTTSRLVGCGLHAHHWPPRQPRAVAARVVEGTGRQIYRSTATCWNDSLRPVKDTFCANGPIK